jgi:hypothetical protein
MHQNSEDNTSNSDRTEQKYGAKPIKPAHQDLIATV